MALGFLVLGCVSQNINLEPKCVNYIEEDLSDVTICDRDGNGEVDYAEARYKKDEITKLIVHFNRDRNDRNFFNGINQALTSELRSLDGVLLDYSLPANYFQEKFDKLSKKNYF
ncbi:hypothetical protein HY448_00005 [Candidatus Pacearchaeota archaeon]|nr:hypothetical protein [Candidatus Pacearchaeota archaeon]